MDLIPPSVVESYDLSHLHALATHMTTSVADREELMGSVNGLAAGQVFEGAGREGQTVPLAEHNEQATTTSAALSATAAVAVAGAGSLYSQKQELVAGLGTAKAAQLQVDDEWNVTDPLAGTPIAAMRASAVQALQSQLQTGAQAFTQTEQTTAQAIYTAMGDVQGWDRGDGHTTWIEKQPDGGLFTWNEKDGPDYTGNWPDAAKNGEGRASMMDYHFKTDGPGGGDNPFNDPPMPEIGADEGAVGAAGVISPMEQGMGGPPMPKDWPKFTPTPTPPKCSYGEYAKDVVENIGATAGTTAGLVAAPETIWNPLFVPWMIAEGRGVEAVIDTSGSVIDCATRGLG